MSSQYTITASQVLQQIKLSCQLPTIVSAFLTRQIVAAQAKKVGLQIQPEELQQAADRLRQKNNLWSTDATWEWLNTHHLTIDDFEQMAYDAVLSSKLAQHLFAAKVEPYLAEHQLDYTQVVLYEIIVPDADFALELFYALQEQEITFATAARQYNQDEALRRQAGYRGLQNRAQLPATIAAAVFAAQPPQLLPPMTIASDTHLIWVEEIIPPQLDDTLRTTILSELFSTWLQQQIKRLEPSIVLQIT